MIYVFKGSYLFDSTTITNWDSVVIGVYYCGVKTVDEKLAVYYIGKSVADGGIRGRLLQHLSERKWPDVIYFDYEQCDTATETERHELEEIAKFKQKLQYTR